MKLHPNEEELIKKIRTKYKYGEIVVIIHDGIPKRIKKAWSGDSLSPQQNETKKSTD